MEALAIAHKAVEAASDKQAADIVLFDVREVCSFADYFVICTGETERQLRAIHDEVERALREEGVRPFHREGSGSGWLLLDFGDIIVHVFTPFEREYYRLEELWNKANPIVRIQ